MLDVLETILMCLN